ncbi:T9SS type A sorting domain-containing protein [Candidatus Aerophobetes bacterium]|uniref:T9SS type A sorting domain-containing protein n=1 Tax=Aerophobetes bacterium TaxID=2030807 RepID=A0A523UUN6_UNCAE|nr:MAG: T9SS type A sorting domain-containing protein [Candidatus Aerophobetes bacterium]
MRADLKVGLPAVAPALESLIVYPNPFKAAAGHSYITFEALTKEVTIRIFTLSGELVRKVELPFQYSWNWDLKNEQGEDVARGIYLYLVTNEAGEMRRGKIAVL